MRESLWRLLSPIFPKPSPCSRSAEQRHWSSCSSSRFSCKKKSREAFQESCLPLLVLSNATLTLTTKKKKTLDDEKKKKQASSRAVVAARGVKVDAPINALDYDELTEVIR